MFLPDSFVNELGLLTKHADAVLGYKPKEFPVPSLGFKSTGTMKPVSKSTNYSLTNSSAPVSVSGVASNTKSVPPPVIRK